ncbi:ABC transporter permease [Amycolatopsis sp. GM8]|uniref:ABC transporter permease n=1 Tax=Amycolatopsis sp. GM8 TaxID=2896530 RepID=UPI001F3C7FE9|nr:ABC transporter permease [Amycolatopsis sp. GM8]
MTEVSLLDEPSLDEPPVVVRSKRRVSFGAAQVGATLICLLIALAIWMWAFGVDPNAQDLSQADLSPFSPGHPLGTDTLGRDILSWCARGVLTSLAIGVAVALLCALAGALIGATAGYLGGWVDSVLMRLVDLQLAVPPLLIFLAASMVIDRNIVSMVLLLASVGWVPYARLVRATVLSERERGYIAAARLAGSTRLGIVFRHLLPASATPIVVFASLQVGFVMLVEAGLSFLGLGLEPPVASLGYMIAQGRDQLGSAWWIATSPGVFVVVLILATNLIGDGLRDSFRMDSVGEK